MKENANQDQCFTLCEAVKREEFGVAVNSCDFGTG